MKGIILSYFSVSGFGHLRDDQQDEYSFYSADIHTASGLVQTGDTVFFDLYRGHGTRAINLRPA